LFENRNVGLSNIPRVSNVLLS